MSKAITKCRRRPGGRDRHKRDGAGACWPAGRAAGVCGRRGKDDAPRRRCGPLCQEDGGEEPLVHSSALPLEGVALLAARRGRRGRRRRWADVRWPWPPTRTHASSAAAAVLSASSSERRCRSRSCICAVAQHTVRGRRGGGERRAQETRGRAQEGREGLAASRRRSPTVRKQFFFFPFQFLRFNRVNREFKIQSAEDCLRYVKARPVNMSLAEENFSASYILTK